MEMMSHVGIMNLQNWTPDLLKDKRSALEIGRVARARGLLVEKTGSGIFEVYSDSGRNDVQLYPYFDCSCGDRAWREHICKHIIAALLYVRDPDAQEAVADLERLLSEADLVVLEEEGGAEIPDEAGAERGPAPGGQEYLSDRERRRFRPRERVEP